LIILDPVIAGVAVLVLGVAYAVIFMTIRRIIARNSVQRVAADQLRYTVAREALGGIKDIRMLGKEDAYIEHFSMPSITVSRLNAINLVLGQVPKYLIEAIGFGGMLLLCVALLATSNPVIGTETSTGANAGAILP
jgi:ABC-type bacteriocin/lantibiotic exporter with double-glycine peptidase domain